MKRYAQILWDRVHYVFESEVEPNFPPGPDGEEIVIVEITDRPDVDIHWSYVNGEFVEPIDHSHIIESLRPGQDEVRDAETRLLIIDTLMGVNLI